MALITTAVTGSDFHMNIGVVRAVGARLYYVVLSSASEIDATYLQSGFVAHVGWR